MENIRKWVKGCPDHPMTCPGCQKPMKQAGMMALWVRPDGTILQYQTCPGCTEILSRGGEPAGEITTRIEETLNTRQAAN